jgi:aryl-alcohol dehydrogenase-like predicted oxidoreductase
MAKLCLGTVQFGMKYGVNNQIDRQPTWEESFSMLDYAIENGIEVIDTARAYGEAELVLGEYFRSRGNADGLKIISKLRPNVIEEDDDVYSTVRRELEDSLDRIGVSRLHGYLLHTPEYIYNSEIVAALKKLKSEKMVDNIGVSIYDLKEGYAAIDTGVVDYIQLPYSILDQRGVKDGFINRAKKAGITIFTRSAFLQGLFMMEQQDIPDHLQMAVPYLKAINKAIQSYDVDKITAILSFVCSEEAIDYLVFGVETLGQLKEDIEKYRTMVIPKECIAELKRIINDVDDSIIFPSLWANGRKAE